MARFGVIGAGAIGSTIACRLAAAGEEVVLFARGPRRAAVERDGLRVRIGDTVQAARPLVAESGAAIACDTLFLAVKADALPALLPAIAAASHAGTSIVPLCNGLPWWYRQAGDAPGAAIEAVDPGGRLAAAIDPARIVGAVLFLRAALDADGTVESQGGERMVVGAVAGGGDAVPGIAAALEAAGIACPVAPSIRQVLWSKIALNLATNPLSAVSRATLAQMCDDAHLLGIVRAILAETLALAALDGQAPREGVDDLVAITRRAGPFLTSMAQDAIAGRPLELAAIAQAVLDLADDHGHPMPVARAVAAMAAWLHPPRAAAA
ncbi:2-dehydropantoate 2-reductase [Rhizorhabdus wittichii DC-6]|nr:2-dehydropantoate 2-reductase [Rhizorhabdus wittichii DC-6]